ncbi:MAG: hypothetical protein ACRD18_02330, partial [Terriglobia bacterium]
MASFVAGGADAAPFAVFAIRRVSGPIKIANWRLMGSHGTVFVPWAVRLVKAHGTQIVPWLQIITRYCLRLLGTARDQAVERKRTRSADEDRKEKRQRQDVILEAFGVLRALPIHKK